MPDTPAARAAAVAAPLPTYSNTQIADYLESGFWTPRSFNLGSNGAAPKNGVVHYNVDGLTAAGRTMAERALGLYEAVLDIDFVRTRATSTSQVEILFKDTVGGAYTTMEVRQGNIHHANVNVGVDWLSSYGTTVGTYSFQTYVHEIGHALGLGHAGDYNGGATYVSNSNDPDFGFGSNHYLNDSWQTTVMSYFTQTENTSIDASYAFLISPMVADWIALTEMYGARTAFAGDTTWGFNTTITGTAFANLAGLANKTAFTIIDGGGRDTVDFSGYAAAQRIDLTPEAFSDVGGLVGNMAIARGSQIENAVGGAGADRITGNAASNLLDGRGGRDELHGGAGNDTLLGQNGNDRLFGGGGRDSLAGGEGADALFGETGTDWLGGGKGADALDGGVGKDTLVGHEGKDVLIGGLGGDTFVFRSAADSPAGAGRDVIRAGGGAGAFDAPGAGAGDLLDFTLLGDLSWGGAGQGAIGFRNVGNATVCSINLDAAPGADFELEILDGAVLASAYTAQDVLFL
jgi:serralysin